MTLNKPSRRSLGIALVLCAPDALAAAAASSAFSGHIAVGYRDVDVAGDEPKYQQQINLDDGARLIDLGVVVRPDSQQAGVPDRIEVNAYGLGGDPYESLQVRIGKHRAYDFRYDRHRTEYFYEDLLVAPEDASISGSTGGDFHHFDTERVRDNLSLDIDLSSRAKVTLGFDRYELSGDATTTLDIEREEFELDKPIDETMESYAVGLEYAWDKVFLTLTERWQNYDNADSAFLPGFSSGNPSAPAELDFLFLDQPYSFDTRDHQLSLRVRPDDRWEIRIDAQVSDLDLDVQATERSQGLSFAGVPFSGEITGDASVNRDTELFRLGVAYAITDRVRLTTSARKQRLDQDGMLLFGDVDGVSRWRIDTSSYEVGLDVAVTDTLAVAAGWAGERRETNVSQDSEGDSEGEAVQTDRDGYFANLSYRPNRHLQITLSAEDNRIDDPFTLASATDARRYRLQARYRWDNGLILSATHRRTDYENHNSGWNSDTKQTDIRLTHTTDRLTLSVGAAWVDLQRDIDQLVTGGSRQDLFAIDYSADADFWDGSASWRLTDRIDLAASYRAYDNNGSFQVDRDDTRASVEVALPDNYRLQLSYRNVDYKEDQLESFDADIWEIALKYRW